MSRWTGRVLRGVAIAAAMSCAYSLGFVTGASPAKRAEPARPTVLDEAADRLSSDAAEPVPRAELDRAAINGMLRRLGDRWARYYTAQEYDDAEGRLNGRYSGVGLWLGTDDDESTVRIASVQPGSPAEHAGIQAGDIVTAVGGEPVLGWSVTRIAMALRGQPATGIDVVVRRGAAQLRIRLVRSAVHESDVSVEERAANIQIVRVTAFTRGVGHEISAVVTRSPARHRGGIVLDLRGNPGGLLDEAVQTASAFLADGPVITYERRGAKPQQLNAAGGGDTGTPLVVLVDAGTASAAEVVAGSLKDRDRAVIVGSRTFGKGSVQEPVRLMDGSAIELTVGRYRTPGGRNLDGVGIEPDVVVSADRSPRQSEQRALTVLRGLLAQLPTTAPSIAGPSKAESSKAESSKAGPSMAVPPMKGRG